jgi:hypothetical protein
MRHRFPSAGGRGERFADGRVESRVVEVSLAADAVAAPDAPALDGDPAGPVDDLGGQHAATRAGEGPP